ncbi:MAG: ATP-binding protein [Nostoc sp.]|uniref:ATP-binding protein n=1 Tax=Nostoc sp. TaxID=1180 RepID=UPI002FF9D090
MTDKFKHRAINLEVVPFPVRIKAEWNQLIQLLSHLISNAVKHSHVGDLVTLQLTQPSGWTIN